MPPFTIDPTDLFAAIVKLANEKDQSWRWTKKGDKRPWQDIEASRAGRRAADTAKQQAATERALARQKAARPLVPRGEGIAHRMLAAMQPGEWYGMGDLARMVGADRTARGKVHQVLVKRGWVEAARNPAYSGATLDPWEIMAGAEPQPERLYRLTERGYAERNKRACLDEQAGIITGNG